MTKYSFLALVLIEFGIYKYLVKPLWDPLKLYAVFYFNALLPKKRMKLYSMKKDCKNIDILQSDDEEDRRNTLAGRKLLKIVDTDPKREETRVIESLKDKKKHLSRTSLTISKLSKSYILEQPAVENLSFQLEYGECFALLGITGAGKTTTFKCLTGEESPDKGDLFMGGENLRSFFGFDKARCLIGYCPQFDAIFENLTVK